MKPGENREKRGKTWKNVKEKTREQTDRERKRKKRNSGSASRTRERIGHQARKERGVGGQGGGKQGRHVMGKIKSGQLCMCEGWPPLLVRSGDIQNQHGSALLNPISPRIYKHTRSFSPIRLPLNARGKLAALTKHEKDGTGEGEGESA